MLRFTLPHHADSVASLAWLPDGSAVLLGLADGGVALWSVAACQERDRLPAHAGPVGALALADDGRRLATGGADGRVRVWDLSPVTDGLLSRADCLAEHALGAPVRALAWSPGGRMLAASDQRGAVLGLDLDDPAPRFKLRRPAADAEHLLWQRDTSLWGGGEQGLALLWLPDTDLERHITPTGARVLALASSREERLMLACLADGRVIDHPDESSSVLADAGERVRCWASASARVFTLLFRGTEQGVIGVHLHERGAPAAPACATFQAHRGPVTALACAPDGFGLVSVGGDGHVHLWQQGEAAPIDAPTKKPYERWCGVSRSDAGAIALTGGLSLGVLGQPLHITVDDDQMWGGYGDLVWSPAGDSLIAVDVERADLRRYDLAGRQLARRPHERSFAGGLACSREGLVAVSTRQGGVTIVDADFATLAELDHPSDVTSLAWSCDGLLAALDDGGALRVLADRGRHPRFSLPTRAWSGQPHSLAWSPDGSHLAVGGDALLLVDVAAGAVLRRHACALNPAFSPNGRWLAVCTPPRTVVVWDWRAGTPLASWQRQPARDTSYVDFRLAWRDDHSLLVIDEHRITAWSLAPFAPDLA